MPWPARGGLLATPRRARSRAGPEGGGRLHWPVVAERVLGLYPTAIEMPEATVQEVRPVGLRRMWW